MWSRLIKIQYIINGDNETVRQLQYANSLYVSESTVMQNNYRGNDSTNGHVHCCNVKNALSYTLCHILTCPYDDLKMCSNYRSQKGNDHLYQ
jgi:hypothetical protein